MEDTKKEKIKFIDFKPSHTDMMKSSSHQNIADSIIKIINETDNGMVIGLEGEYGSGKSTIIEIIEANISKKTNIDKKDIFIFKFDSWAHENDTLRRIFLEELIETLRKDIENKGHKKECVEKHNQILSELATLNQEVTNKPKNVTLTKRITAKWHTKIIALTALLVPIGMALNNKIEVIYWWQYLIVIVLICAPLIAIFLPFLFDFFKKYTVPVNKNSSSDESTKKEYSLCTEETTENTQVYSDDDNTSIEFERYFEKIIKQIKKKYEKILIVIDNLDRINQTSVVKIWSTLQIFVQNNINNIYTLIPFDHDRMKNVWFGETINKETKNDSDSFFDKCFQLIIDVPKPIYSDMSNYLKSKAREIFEDQETCGTVELIINSLNKSNDNSFTQRKINNYLNQIKMLQVRFQNYNINLKVFSFYAYYRIINNESLEILRNNLLTENLVDVNNQYLLNDIEEYKFDFASIIFGVKKETAKEILLTEQIRKALLNNNDDNLKLNLIKIYEKNQRIFDNYLRKVIKEDSKDISLILKYSSVIKKAIDEGPKELKDILKSEDCIKQFKNVFPDKLNLPWPDTQQEIEQYINLVELISQDKDAIKKFHKLWIETIKTYLNIETSRTLMIIKSNIFVTTVTKIMSKYIFNNQIEITKISSLNGNWFEAILIDKKNLEVFNYILPDFDDNQALELFKTHIDHSSYALNIIRYLIQRCPDDCKYLVYKVINFYFMYAKTNQLSEKENTFKISLELLSHTINFKTNLTTAIKKVYNEHIEYTNLSSIKDIKNELIKKYS